MRSIEGSNPAEQQKSRWGAAAESKSHKSQEKQGLGQRPVLGESRGDTSEQSANVVYFVAEERNDGSEDWGEGDDSKLRIREYKLREIVENMTLEQTRAYLEESQSKSKYNREYRRRINMKKESKSLKEMTPERRNMYFRTLEIEMLEKMMQEEGEFYKRESNFLKKMTQEEKDTYFSKKVEIIQRYRNKKMKDRDKNNDDIRRRIERNIIRWKEGDYLQLQPGTELSFLKGMNPHYLSTCFFEPDSMQED